jgi:hypothetical protein
MESVTYEKPGLKLAPMGILPALDVLKAFFQRKIADIPLVSKLSLEIFVRHRPTSKTVY